MTDASNLVGVPELRLDRAIATHIARVLELHDWNMKRAADALAIDRRTLYRMCERFSIARPWQSKFQKVLNGK